MSVVAEGQVDVGPEIGAQIDDVIPEETLGDRQASKSHVEDFNAVGSAMVNSIDWKPSPSAKPFT